MILSGGVGKSPVMELYAISSNCTDEFSKTSEEPSNPVKELLTRFTMLRRGNFQSHSGTFPLILLLEMSI